MTNAEDEARASLRAFWERQPELLQAIRAAIRDPELRRHLAPPTVPPGFE